MENPTIDFIQKEIERHNDLLEANRIEHEALKKEGVDIKEQIEIVSIFNLKTQLNRENRIEIEANLDKLYSQFKNLK